MNTLKNIGLVSAAAGKITKQDWLFIISIAITLLGMLQDYLKNRKE